MAKPRPIRDRHVTDARFRVGEDMRVRAWSSGAERLLGVPAGRALGRPCHEVVRGEDRAGRRRCGARCPAWRALAGGEVRAGCDLRVEDARGVKRWVRCEVTALPAVAGAGGGAVARLAPAAASGGEGVSESGGEGSGESYDVTSDLVAVANLTRRLGRRPLREGLAWTLDFLRQATRADSAEAFLAEPGGTGMVLTTHRGAFRRAFAQIPRFADGEGFPGRVLRDGEAVVSLDLPHDERYLRSDVKECGYSSYLCAALVAPGGVVGSLGLAFRRRGVDQEGALRLLEWVASPLSLAVDAHLARVRSHVHTRVRPSEGWLGGRPERPVEEVLGGLLDELVELSDASEGTLRLVRGSSAVPGLTLGRGTGRHASEAHAVTDPPRCKALEEGGTGCPVIATGQGQVLRGRREAWPRACRSMARRGGASLCVPVHAGEEVVGVARLRPGARPRSVASERLALLEAAAHAARDDVRFAMRASESERLAPREGRDGAATPAGDTAAPALEVRCFGRFELYRAGRLVDASEVRRKKALTLLKILLARRGAPISREELIAWLWPDAELGARTSQFHVLVHHLRHLLQPHREEGEPSYVRISGERYWLELDGGVRSDEREFRRLVDAGRRHVREDEPRRALAAFERAVGWYRGEYMEDEPDAPWAWFEREELREACLDASCEAGRLRAAIGDVAAAIPHYRRALSFDPLREHVHRSLMRVLHEGGRRAEAVRQYFECAAVLREELGLAPCPDTEAFYLELQDAAPEPPA